MMGRPGTAPYRIQVVIRTLYGNQYLDRNAYIDMDLRVADRAGAIIYSDTVKDKRAEPSLFSGGLFGDIDVLGKYVQTLLNASMDRMLDKPALRAVLGGDGARPAVGS